MEGRNNKFLLGSFEVSKFFHETMYVGSGRTLGKIIAYRSYNQL